MVQDARKNGAGYPGACAHCGSPATKEAHCKEDGATVIEKYCQQCSEPPMFERLQEWYGRI